MKFDPFQRGRQTHQEWRYGYCTDRWGKFPDDSLIGYDISWDFQVSMTRSPTKRGYVCNQQNIAV